jgi:hypothetical protein
MSIYTPYTYLITFLPTGQRYYGVRTKQGCSPKDLWNSYYTSSKLVRQLIEQHGKELFSFEIRKTFVDSRSAILWEHRVLRRLNAAEDPRWLNKNNGNRKFLPKESHDAETKAKIGAKHKGKTMSDESKDKMRQTMLERYGDSPPWLSKESNAKRSQSNKKEPWNKGLTGWNKGRIPWNKGHKKGEHL